MNYRLLGILLILIWSSGVFAQQQAVNLSLIHPISLVKDDNTQINCNIALLHSRAASLKGFGLSGGLQIWDQSASGIQISGLATYSGGKLRGTAISGFANISLDQQKGIFLAGLANMGFSDVKGAQISFLNNFVADSLKGLQLSSGYNMSAGRVHGAQITGIMNVSGGMFTGLQMSAAANICLSEFHGMQLSIFNIAHELKGMQLGLVNIAGNTNGFQLGIVNYADEFKGLNIGLVNISDRTKTQLLIGGGNFVYGSAAVRFTTNNFYTTLGIGSPLPELDEEFSGAVFYRLGHQFPISLLRINTDLGFAHLSQYDTDLSEYSSGFALQMRASIETQLYKGFGLFLAGGYQWLSKSYKDVSFEDKPIFELGVVLF